MIIFKKKMNHFKSEELNFLSKRGLIKALTHPEKLDEKFAKNEKITFYIGFDCTASSFHIGHLIPIMITRYLISKGHKAIIILGTTTAKIGDPSGKNQTRKILSEEEIAKNFNSLSVIIKKFLDQFSNNGKNIIFLENNWLEKMPLVSFLREFGSLFSVNRMINMETFKRRLENQENLSFLEFTYSLFQSYDFYHLNKEFNCELQIGGSDQWGNIVAGIEFGEKLLPEKNFFGLTCELLLNSAGEKMGKTASGAIWLDEKLLSPFEYWQYFRNIDDNDVLKVLNFLTDFSNSEISDLSSKYINSDINALKAILATKITEICHGKEKAEEAQALAKQKFETKIDFSKPESLSGLKTDFMIDSEKQILDFLKLCMPENSNTEFRKLASQNAIKINGQIFQDISKEIKKDSSFLHGEKKFLLEIGKKKKFVFEFL